MYFPCGSMNYYTTRVTGAQTPAQTSGALHLEITGILIDASPFTVASDVPLR